MEMGPRQIPMKFQLLEAARSGNVNALIAALPPAADSQFPDHNNQTLISILPGDATDAALQSEDVRNHTTAPLSPAGETELSAQHNNHTAVVDISIREDATDGAHQSKDVNAPTAPVSPVPITDHELSNDSQTNHAAKESEIIFGVTIGGNTVLHIAAEYGHLKLAQEVCRRAPSLVAAVNTRLETSLHCCARTGHDQIVSLIINTARSSCRDGGAYGLLDVLRARNVHGETALHEACRFGHCKVSAKLIAADVDLATFVSDAGMSPLYLAVMRNSTTTVGLFRQLPCPSLLGPGGRTALHAAVSRSQEITTLMLLTWKREMAKFADDSHSTPLHYVAADGDENMTRILLEHDPSTAYISDKDGYFPIHVAASMDHVRVIQQIMKQCPDSLELVDYNGRNFFHVAVVERSLRVVRYVIRESRGLEKLLNQRDNDGNTPLHLAVSHKFPKRLVYTMLRNRSIETSIMNNQGCTQLDLSYKLESGIYYGYNAETLVMKCLANCGAIFSPQRSDYAIQARDRAYDPEKEAKKITPLSRNMAIPSVLIATVTFAAGFTMPGGYKSDNGKSILTRKYPFKVFLISDTCAMIFSLIATFQIIHAGTSFMDNSLRGFHILCSCWMLWISFAFMCVAFGMASFAVVVPKAWGLGVLVCVLTFIAPLFITFITREPLVHTRCTIISRNGRMRSNMDPHTRRRLQGHAWVSFWSLACRICLLLFVYLALFILTCGQGERGGRSGSRGSHHPPARFEISNARNDDYAVETLHQSKSHYDGQTEDFAGTAVDARASSSKMDVDFKRKGKQKVSASTPLFLTSVSVQKTAGSSDAHQLFVDRVQRALEAGNQSMEPQSDSDNLDDDSILDDSVDERTLWEIHKSTQKGSRDRKGSGSLSGPEEEDEEEGQREGWREWFSTKS